MRGGMHYYGQAQNALNEIGVATNYGSHSPDLAMVSLHRMYRPAHSLCWHRERGWTLDFDGRDYADDIPIGPPDMTPGKAARAVAQLLTRQAQGQADAVKAAVYAALGEAVEKRLGWETVADLRKQIIDAQNTDVLAAQDGADGG